MPFLSTPRCRVFYRRAGHGPTVVMLHANLHDGEDFAPVAEALSRRYTTVVPDWPGHGRSDTPGVPVDAFLVADTLRALVDGLGLPPAVFIGNSVGGYAAARLAIDRPDRVAGLVLVNSGGFLRSTAASRAWCRLLGTRRLNRVLQPLLVPAYMRARGPHDRAVARRAIDRARSRDGSRVAASMWRSFGDPRFDLRGDAARIAAPTLFVWGTRDVVLPLRAGRDARRAVPGSRLHPMDTGHVVFASDPDGFLAVVEPFLRETTASVPD